MLQITDSTVLNFLSTYAQSLAALVGLSASFSIFRHQNHQKQIEEKTLHISRHFNSHQNHFLFDEQQLRSLKKLSNHDQRAIYIETVYRSKLDKKDERMVELESWILEFDSLADTKQRMVGFRKRFLMSNAFGLALIILSIIGIAAADQMTDQGTRLAVLLAATALVAVYFVSLFVSIRHSVEKPLFEI